MHVCTVRYYVCTVPAAHGHFAAPQSPVIPHARPSVHAADAEAAAQLLAHAVLRQWETLRPPPSPPPRGGCCPHPVFLMPAAMPLMLHAREGGRQDGEGEEGSVCQVPGSRSGVPGSRLLLPYRITRVH